MRQPRGGNLSGYIYLAIMIILIIAGLWIFYPFLNSTQEAEEPPTYDEIYEEAYQDGYSEGESDGYSKGMEDAASSINDSVYEAAYSAGNYEDLLGMIQSYLDADGEFTLEEAREAVNRLYYEFESLDQYRHEVRETKDPWQSTRQWGWDEPYPGPPWEDK